MTRLLVVFASLACLAGTCNATSYRQFSPAELVGHADVIVIGTVVELGKNYRVTVTSTLYGKAEKEITFPHSGGFCKVKDEKIFFLRSAKEGLWLLNPYTYADLSQEKEFRRLVEFKTEPKKFIDNPKQSGSVEFMQILVPLFEKTEKVGDFTRADAVKHFYQCLKSDEEKVVLLALEGLEKTKTKLDAATLIPMIDHSSQRVQIKVVELLAIARDKKAFEPLCKALDKLEKETNDNPFQPHHIGALGATIGYALRTLGDPAAVPVLKRALKRGIGCEYSLASLGDESCFELVLERAEKAGSTSAVAGMSLQVKRSNKKHEEWMDENEYSSETGLKNVKKWRKWWDENKADFKITKTAEEAIRVK